MLLAIDVGNTNIVLGVYENGRWAHHWRVRTARDKMPDEYDVLFRALFREAGLELQSFGRVAMCSGVPPLTGVLSEMLENALGKRPLIIGPGVRSGIRIRTDNPSEVGADLVADAVAAYERLGTSCIVVDFGTATTFTAVAAPGGAIRRGDCARAGHFRQRADRAYLAVAARAPAAAARGHRAQYRALDAVGAGFWACRAGERADRAHECRIGRQSAGHRHRRAGRGARSAGGAVRGCGSLADAGWRAPDRGAKSGLIAACSFAPAITNLKFYIFFMIC